MVNLVIAVKVGPLPAFALGANRHRIRATAWSGGRKDHVQMTVDKAFYSISTLARCCRCKQRNSVNTEVWWVGQSVNPCWRPTTNRCWSIPRGVLLQELSTPPCFIGETKYLHTLHGCCSRGTTTASQPNSPSPWPGLNHSQR